MEPIVMEQVVLRTHGQCAYLICLDKAKDAVGSIFWTANHKVFGLADKPVPIGVEFRYERRLRGGVEGPRIVCHP